ncbi:MAG: alkaline phosphatase family protein [Acidobacteriaceae bacterium]
MVHGLPIGAGFRVPCILISPWTTGGWVCGQPFDRTSVLQLLEPFTGVREPNVSPWRRQTFGDRTLHFASTLPQANRRNCPIQRLPRISPGMSRPVCPARLSDGKSASSKPGKWRPQARLERISYRCS